MCLAQISDVPFAWVSAIVGALGAVVAYMFKVIIASNQAQQALALAQIQKLQQDNARAWEIVDHVQYLRAIDMVPKLPPEAGADVKNMIAQMENRKIQQAAPKP